MQLRVQACYSHLTRTNVRWRDCDHSIKKFVDAIKGRPIHGYAHLRVHPGEPLRQLEQANAGEAVDWFGEIAAEFLCDAHLTRPILVPVPDSQCSVEAARSPRTLRLATAVRRNSPSDVADILRFARQAPSAHAEAGTRDASAIYSLLTLVSPVNLNRPYVIVDDVLATGGHVRAVAAFLKHHGADVRLAICAVAAELVPANNPFARISRILPDLESSSAGRGQPNPVVDLVLEPGDRVA